MRTGRPLAIVTITIEQREELENWSRRPKTAQALALRSCIVLLAADGTNNKAIAKTTFHHGADGGQMAAALSRFGMRWSAG